MKSKQFPWALIQTGIYCLVSYFSKQTGLKGKHVTPVVGYSTRAYLLARSSYGWHWQPWTSYQIRKIAGCVCAGNAGNDFPRRRFQSKPLVSDPGMHHGTCVTHVPLCMSGSLTCGDGVNVPGIPDACAPAILHIWQEAHVQNNMSSKACYNII